MTDDLVTLKHMYERFNALDMDGVLACLTDDVVWANGMDGGHEQGRDAVRAYWTRQWAVLRGHVEPVGFSQGPDGTIIAEVRQTVRGVDGQPLDEQTHGLHDRTVQHVFRFRDGRVARFDIGDAG
jgi:ketosteroid isomerase-like protein